VNSPSPSFTKEGELIKEEKENEQRNCSRQEFTGKVRALLRKLLAVTAFVPASSVLGTNGKRENKDCWYPIGRIAGERI